MRDLSPGWATDLAVLEQTGSTVEDRGDHLVVRSPANPDFHWGNCLFVLEADSVDDAPRWVGTFGEAFPQATWVAIGLVRIPDDPAAWTGLGLALELDDVLTARQLPAQTAVPQGYTVRRLAGDDWEQSVARAMAENDRTNEHERDGHERFVRAQTRTRIALSERGVAAWFGAFRDGVLVADLGVVRCGPTARYQAVGTDETHRGRGLASHLLGVAASWSADRGCDRWVIVTEASNPAGRVYRRAGFEPDVSNAQAYRRPDRGTG